MLKISWIIILLAPAMLMAQGENNIWVMNAGVMLDFNSEPAKMIFDAGADAFPFELPSLTVSDADGQMKFYCIGDNVYNREKAHTPNGVGTTSRLRLDHDAIKLAVVRSAANTNKYYIFSLHINQTPKESWTTLKYSLFDQSLDDGLGDIIPEYKHVTLADTLTDHITVAHGRADEIYLVCHKSLQPEFLAFPINADGLGDPIVSSIGSYFPQLTYTLRGNMKYNAQRDIISVNTATRYYDRGGVFARTTPWLELFCFDRATGGISNHLVIDSLQECYDTAISRDGTRLYTRINTKLYQYDISILEEEKIRASKTVVLTTGFTPSHKHFRMGADGDIYFVLYSLGGYMPLCAIDNADADPEHISIDCERFSSRGAGQYAGLMALPDPMLLPQEIPVRTAMLRHLSDTISICRTDERSLSAGTIYHRYPLQWSTGDTSRSILLSPEDSLIWVELADGSCDPLRDTIYIEWVDELEVDLGPDTRICDEDGAAIYVRDAADDWQYVWSDSTMVDTLYITESGVYSVEVMDAHGCIGEGSVEMTFSRSEPVSVVGDTILCPEESIVLGTDLVADSYRWSTGSTESTISISDAGVYSVKIMSDGCPSSASITIVDQEDCDCDIYIPNVLNASSALGNDLWHASSNCRFDMYDMIVYDRWGSAVYRSQDSTEYWSGLIDADLGAEGIYTYLLRYRFGQRGSVMSAVGSVMLLH